MTEQNILEFFRAKKGYEAEIAILRDCSDMVHESDQSQPAQKYAVLKRRLTLVEHWLNYLPPVEKLVVERHLIQNEPWPYIAAQIDREREDGVVCDERTLQRQQARAIQRIHTFMNEQFSDTLDFLVDDSK